MVAINTNYYLFGGLSQHTYNDLKVLEPEDNEWSAIHKDDPELHYVQGRYGHSMCVFNRFLVIFGGIGAYI